MVLWEKQIFSVTSRFAFQVSQPASLGLDTAVTYQDDHVPFSLPEAVTFSVLGWRWGLLLIFHGLLFMSLGTFLFRKSSPFVELFLEACGLF